jgi:hypothetical protein
MWRLWVTIIMSLASGRGLWGSLAPLVFPVIGAGLFGPAGVQRSNLQVSANGIALSLLLLLV